ncbi:DUF1217 domain-containing protein [Pseudoroseicyclus aestuarii]|uniref:Uncharacterized protein DUF1217 n=1 Tax=Pseudoroseicyclus aestuarii TaxID=1795041 RepID=A0A318SRL4_9RHOB|nr:DUF1217 domain-containing protein [Pseudoroseicyclus aestuarii]PYE84571.1 uncharacterized protein DUF1217 [Pseudoroseicyclus aestuarii]
MSFQPVLPLSGYTGWRFLQRTLDSQQEAFSNSGPVKTAAEYFRENISKAATAEDLVADRRLLGVALGAFGLDEDIDAKAFIKKVLAEGTLEKDALASKLSDKRYARLAEAFGYGNAGPRVWMEGFADEIIDKYQAKQFQVAVGEQNESLRLALNVTAGLEEIGAAEKTDNAAWFGMMGNGPLRAVFEGALGFPKSFGKIDLDQQLDQFRSRAQSTFGTSDMAEIAGDPQLQEKLVRLYLIRSEASAMTSLSGANAALTLLSNLR